MIAPATMTDVSHAPTGDSTLAADARLALVRRVDWRFLLPRPEIGVVLGWGPLPRDLRAGLAAAGIAVVDPGSAEWKDGAAGREEDAVEREASVVEGTAVELPMHDTFDGVVMAIGHRHRRSVSAPATHVAGAIDHVRPGGWLIVEVHGWARRPFTPRGWVARLERGGLAEAAAFLLWPSFETCGQMIPVEPAPAAALRYAVDRGAGGPWQRALGRLAVAAGVLPAAAPHFVVIGRKPGGMP